MQNIIAICGFKRSGKSTISKYLCYRHGYFIQSFADPLKKAGLELGLTLDETYTAKKDDPCELLGGKSPRSMWNALGGMLAQHYGEGFLAKMWERDMGFHPRICIDDLRMPEELAVLKGRGAKTIRVYRDGCELEISRTEKFIPELNVDFEIYNNSSFESLYEKLDLMIRVIENKNS